MNRYRAKQYSKHLVDKYDIDCRSLVVLTEAASGGYLYNPMIAILAGAAEVITFCRDSWYGNSADVFQSMIEESPAVDLEGELAWL